ncbi:orn/Lys/Arg decarboxylase, major domain protein, partial [Vibrio parahaemolyticus V-223/04]
LHYITKTQASMKACAFKN